MCHKTGVHRKAEIFGRRPSSLYAVLFMLFMLAFASGILLSARSHSVQAAPGKTGYEKEFIIRIINPEKRVLEKHPVVVGFEGIHKIAPDFNPAKFAVIPEMDESPEPIPAQVDDLDSDGKPDELVFLANLSGSPALQFRCRYSPQGSELPNFPEKTYARLAWETQNANIGWESNLAAYRFYWGQMEAFGKLNQNLIMHLFNANYTYHDTQEWGMDVLHVGNASGLGGISLWEGETRISAVNPAGKGENKYERKVVAAGPVRAVARVDISNIKPAKNTFAITLLMSVFADNRFSRQDIIINSNEAGNIIYSPGVQKLAKETWKMDKDKGFLATWGEGAPGAGEVGLGLMFVPGEYAGFSESDIDRYIKLQIPAGKKRTHWILGGWHQGVTAPKPPAAENWAVMVQELGEKLRTPLQVVLASK